MKSIKKVYLIVYRLPFKISSYIFASILLASSFHTDDFYSSQLAVWEHADVFKDFHLYIKNILAEYKYGKSRIYIVHYFSHILIFANRWHCSTMLLYVIRAQ